MCTFTIFWFHFHANVYICNALYGTRGGVTSQTPGCFHFRGFCRKKLPKQLHGPEFGIKGTKHQINKMTLQPWTQKLPWQRDRVPGRDLLEHPERSSTRWELDGADMEWHHLQPTAIPTYHQTNPLQRCTPAFQQELYLQALFFCWTHCRLPVQTELPSNPHTPSMHPQDFGQVWCTFSKSTNNLSQG